MTGPIQGLRVIDLSTGLATARAGGLLADYGADVIWVEPPGGAAIREQFPVETAVFHRGKRSVVLDLTDAGARTELLGLIERADVLLEDWGPGGEPGPEFAANALAERFPALVQCTITAFTPGSEHAGLPSYEALIHAAAGTMFEQIGHRDGPIFQGLPFASIGAAYLATMGTLATLLRRADDGHGRHVETSLFDGVHAFLSGLLSQQWEGRGSHEANLREQIPTRLRLVCGAYRCADDEFIGVHTGAVGAFGRLMTLVGLDDRVPPSENGMDMTLMLTPGEREALEDLHGIFLGEPREVWVKRLHDADICGIPVLRQGEIFDEPQARFNDMVITIDDPVLGRIEEVAPSIKFAVTPAIVRRPAPRIGEHTADVLAELHEPVPDVRLWLGAGPRDDRPLLAGVRVIDAGAYYAGPYASRLLADFGADVIKLEPVRGDQFRGAGGMFRSGTAGKRSLALDLYDQEARQAAYSVIATADVVCHNMRPGAAERLGIDDDHVRAINPSVIYGHAVGWGTAGPNSDWQSFEPMMSGYVGVGLEVAGRFNEPLYAAGNADPGNGLAGCVGALLALLHRHRTGEGQHFVNAQINATMVHLAHVVRQEDGTVLGANRLDPMQYGWSATERLYETADGWLCLAALTKQEFSSLGDLMGLGDDYRFSTGVARAEHDYELSQILANAFAQRGTEAWLADLSAASVPAVEPVEYDNGTFMADPDNRETGRVVRCEDPESNGLYEVGQLVRVSGVTVPPHRGAPGLGAHTAEILQESGYPTDALNALRVRGVAR